jgi:hypothetical protein
MRVFSHHVVPANGAGYCRPDDRLRRGPIPSGSVMRKVSAIRGGNVPSNNHRWLWVPAFAGTTNGVKQFAGSDDAWPDDKEP